MFILKNTLKTRPESAERIRVSRGHLQPAEIGKDFRLYPHYAFQGHTHVPGVFSEDFQFSSPEELNHEYHLKDEKVMINVGSVGQPCDGDPRACYVVLEDDLVRFRRIECMLFGNTVAVDKENYQLNYLE